MQLLPDSICLPQPLGHFFVYLGFSRESEVMNVIAWGNGIYLAKSRMLQPACENYVAVQPLLPERYGCKTHTNMKGNSGLFGQDGNRPDRLDEGDEPQEDRPYLWRRLGEVVLESMDAAGMRLVSVRKLTTASRARPHWSHRHRVRLTVFNIKSLW
jgi:hypothetical protein